MRAKRPLILLPIAALLGASAFPPPAIAVEKTLPGGTRIAVEIANPTGGAILSPGPVTVTGRAEIGGGQPRADTGLVYVLDVSSSTNRQIGCGGNQNPGNRPNEILDCEIAAAIELNKQAVKNKTVDKVGVVVFGSDARFADVGPSPDDDLRITDPEAGDPNNLDINQVLSSAFIGGIGQFTGKSFASGTDYNPAIRVATQIADATEKRKKIVVFMSDGLNGGGSITQALNDAKDSHVVFKTFAIGSGSQPGDVTCGDPNGNTLERIARETDEGPSAHCVEVPDLSELPSIIPGVIDSHLTALTLRVDGGDPVSITNTTKPLPVTGEDFVDYSVTTDPLTEGPHTLCVTAAGDDVGGPGSVEDCRDIIINAAPVVDARGPYVGNEDNQVPIEGRVDDPDGPNLRTTWSIRPVSGVPPGSVCAFGDENAVSTTVNCTERGVYELILTATDGLHPPVSDRATLTLTNVAPTVDAGGPYSGNEDNQVAIRGTVTDPDGPNLRTTWSIRPVSGVPPGSVCGFGDANAVSTTVSCTERGTYELTLTADDGVNQPVFDTTPLTLTNVPPTVSPGGPYSGNEDNQIPIQGSVSDPDNANPTVTWSFTTTPGVPAGATCTFGDPKALSTVVSCTDHGVYNLTLTADDGVNPPVSNSTTLTLTNVAPTVSAGGPYSGEEDHPVAIAGTVTDPDSPGLTTTWSITPIPGATCTFANAKALSTTVTCSQPGTYTLTLTVNDNVNPPVTATTTVALKQTPGALSLLTTVGPAPGFVGGDPVVVTHTVRNGGPGPLVGIRLTTTLPAALQPAAVSPAGCAATCELGTLAPGQSVQVKLSFNPSAPLDQSLSAAVTTTGPDPVQSDNRATARVVILQPVLTVDPGAGPQGFVTRATGRSFPAGARIRLQWSIGLSETPGEVTVRPDGTFDAQALIFPKDTRGLRFLQALPVTGPRFGTVSSSNPFLVFARSLKPMLFVIR